MPPEVLPRELPAFYRTGTLADMSRMAVKLALARKAIREIRSIENYLESNMDTVMKNEFVTAMKETQDYAVVVADAVSEAIGILKRVKVAVQSYQESVHDATY